jgi:secondary thiamine-phosphate synthase enzyme
MNMDMSKQTTFEISTHGQGLYEFTHNVQSWVKIQNQTTGLLTLFVQHTSCSLLIQENADPEVKTDMTNFFKRLAPDTNHPSMSYLTHTYEGPDDMPAHIKAAMTPVSISIPVVDEQIGLGTWQGIYLFEHRDNPHTRCVIAHLSN